MIIAIDGPAGSGKSTIAKIIARKLGFRHIETGSMYRAVAWKSMQRGIDLNDREAVARVAAELEIEFVPGNENQGVRLDGKDIMTFLKNEAVGRGAATVAAQPSVRRFLVEKQRRIGSEGSAVMDGRDIGTVVFPDADKKFFLDADPEERGKRRFLELQAKNQDVDLKTIIDQVRQRDHEDRTRVVSPLRPAEDAILIDSTNLGIDEVVNKVLRLIGPLPKK